MGNMYEASNQWRDRPPDERFSSLTDLHAMTLARRQASVESRLAVKDMQFRADGEDIVFQHDVATTTPTHWAFGQMCGYLDLPAWHMRRLPAELAEQELNWARDHIGREELIMTWANGRTPGIVRSFTTPMYGRLWDHEAVEWLLDVTQNETNGWHRPPAITDDKYPSGIYGGDRNMFAFMVNGENRLEDGSEGGLGRGFFCWNSEVKQMSFGFQSFLYRYVCGNHIVWGAQKVNTLRMIHLGKDFRESARKAMATATGQYLGQSMSEDQKVINAARAQQLAPKVDDVFTVLTSKRIHFPVADAKAILALAETSGTDPTNLWEVVNAATVYSQRLFSHADQRNEMDRRAARLLDMVRM